MSFWRWAVGGRLAFGVGARLRRTLALDCGVRLPLSFWRRAFGGRLAFGFRRSGTDNAPWPVFVERGRRGRALPTAIATMSLAHVDPLFCALKEHHVFLFLLTCAMCKGNPSPLLHWDSSVGDIHRRFCNGSFSERV